MRPAQLDAALRRGANLQAALAVELRSRQQLGDQRHQALDAWLTANSVRIGALEGRMASLETALASLTKALAAHVADDKRHTGKLGGGL